MAGIFAWGRPGGNNAPPAAPAARCPPRGGRFLPWGGPAAKNPAGILPDGIRARSATSALIELLNDLGQFAGGVALGHFGQRYRLDLAGIAGGAELLVALLDRKSTRLNSSH